jgi:hypothetical protein
MWMNFGSRSVGSNVYVSTGFPDSGQYRGMDWSPSGYQGTAMNFLSASSSGNKVIWFFFYISFEKGDFISSIQHCIERQS